METPISILSFWFGETDASALTFTNRPLWFKKDPEFDDLIRSRFETMLNRANSGELDGWAEESPASALALVILLDQFSRNMYRNSGQSFAYDSKALQVADNTISKGWDLHLSTAGRFFLYLPYVHSEDQSVQNRALELANKLIELAPEDMKERSVAFKSSVEKHYVIIERFGRYPHRNALVGRESTPEEVEFLATNPGF